MAEQTTDKKQLRGESILHDREQRLRSLKQELIAAANAPTMDLSLEEVRKKGLLAVLQKLAGKKSIKPSFDC
jgi:hypothetical protein